MEMYKVKNNKKTLLKVHRGNGFHLVSYSFALGRDMEIHKQTVN